MASSLDLALEVSGLEYRYWKSASINLGLEEVSGSFGLDITDPWDKGGDTRKPLAVGNSCVLKEGGEPVITGWIESVRGSLDAKNHKIQITGRDTTGDLVDCAVANRPASWATIGLLDLAKRLCDPYGVPVSGVGDLGGIFRKFTANPGEKVLAALRRAADQRGVLVRADGRGGLILGRLAPTDSGVTLAEGDNLLSATVTQDDRQRFSRYEVRGQTPNWSQDGDDPQKGQGEGVALDPGARAGRLKVLVAATANGGPSLQERAAFEAAAGAARSLQVTAKVAGWRTGAGQLWRPEMTARFQSTTLGLDRRLMVAQVGLSLDDNAGSTTTLTLVPEGAFSLLPVTAEKGLW